jgi:hypothetical protein
MERKTNVMREYLPLTVTIARDEQALRAAVLVRQSAYARHLPEVARAMVTPESWDAAPGVVVLVARSKLDGSPLGTMRVHSNEFAPLPLEQSFTLPEDFAGLRLVEATRFAIAAGCSPVVKMALCKAFGVYSRSVNAGRMVIAARAPLDRMYERLLFTDVDAAAGYVPLQHVGGLPHRILWLDPRAGKERMEAMRHPLYNFLFELDHPDIDVTGGITPSHAAAPEKLVTEPV